MADSPSTVDRSSSVPAGAAPESVLRNSAGSAPGGSDKSAAGGTGSGTETGGAAESAAASLLLARAQAALRYPEAARRRGTEGIVGLRIELDRTGALANLQVVRSSGSALLDRAAGDAVRTSLPVPNPEGRPIAFELSVRFTLKDKKTASP
jgi:periplasmic protein TonB